MSTTFLYTLISQVEVFGQACNPTVHLLFLSKRLNTERFKFELKQEKSLRNAQRFVFALIQGIKFLSTMGALSFSSVCTLKTFQQTALMQKNLATREPPRRDWPRCITNQALCLQKSWQMLLISLDIFMTSGTQGRRITTQSRNSP